MRRFKLILLFLCRTSGIFFLARWLTRSRLRILCYHGFELADEAAFRPKLFIRTGRFEKRLSTLQRQGFRVLALDEAVEGLFSGSLPERAVVITVDDGFHSFHRVAVSRLRRFGFPAIVYVSTYYVQNPNPIFRLVVQYMFWKSRRQELALDGVPWSENRVVDLANPNQVHQAAWDVINYGERYCTEAQRCRICEELGIFLEVSYTDIVESRIFHLMSPEELAALAEAGIHVGLHTHRHTFPADSRSQAEQEIADNRAALKDWLPQEIDHFCYPSGLWDECQWQWLDDMGLKSSTTCIAGLNSRATPRQALRRFLDGENVHQLEFEAALSGFSDLVQGLRRIGQKIPGKRRRWATLHQGI